MKIKPMQLLSDVHSTHVTREGVPLCGATSNGDGIDLVGCKSVKLTLCADCLRRILTFTPAMAALIDLLIYPENFDATFKAIDSIIDEYDIRSVEIVKDRFDGFGSRGRNKK